MHKPNWLLLVTNLPGRNQTLRMRVWRGLKGAGAASLRDGVYLLPQSANARQVFNEQAHEIRTGGGTAQVMVLDKNEINETEQTEFASMFDRTTEYAAIIRHIDSLKRQLAKLKQPEAQRRITAMRREIATLRLIDFFPGEARTQAEQVLTDTEMLFAERFSSDEPRASHRKVQRLNAADYRGKIWATREHLWVDRICSAWLIRRFIDPKAKFVWLKQVKERPKRALGFDFDDATFTHTNGKVTFEVLMASFGLQQDVALNQLAQLVHYLDVGGVPVAEAAGFTAILTGARANSPDDDALIKLIFPVIDCLYQSYGSDKS